MHFEFESEVFMMAVIAPLLFVEGTHISRTKLLEYRKPIVLMAMALVFATVIGVGFFIHWIWADLPIALQLLQFFALLMQSQFPQLLKVRYYLKGQCQFLKVNHYLMTPGIISFKIAVTALVTGSFQHLMQLANLLFQLF